MRLKLMLLCVCGILAMPLLAQQSSEDQPAIESSQPQLSARAAKQALRSPEFTALVAEALLQRLALGLEGHSLSQTQSAFDRRALGPAFFDQMAEAFDYFESFRVYYRVNEIAAQDAGANLVLDFRMEAQPQQQGSTPQRRNTTLRLKLARVPAGNGSEWRIVGVDPAGFLFEF